MRANSETPTKSPRPTTPISPTRPSKRSRLNPVSDTEEPTNQASSPACKLTASAEPRLYAVLQRLFDSSEDEEPPSTIEPLQSLPENKEENEIDKAVCSEAPIHAENRTSTPLSNTEVLIETADTNRITPSSPTPPEILEVEDNQPATILLQPEEQQLPKEPPQTQREELAVRTPSPQETQTPQVLDATISIWINGREVKLDESKPNLQTYIEDLLRMSEELGVPTYPTFDPTLEVPLSTEKPYVRTIVRGQTIQILYNDLEEFPVLRAISSNWQPCRLKTTNHSKPEAKRKRKATSQLTPTKNTKQKRKASFIAQTKPPDQEPTGHGNTTSHDPPQI